MDIYFLRHADAAASGTHGIMHDADRPLTEAGVKKVKRVAKAMHEMEVSFDAILSSPYRRTKETAEIVGEILECGSLIRTTPHLVLDGNPSALIDEINKEYFRSRQILLVGHEPLLAGMISVLISGRHDVSVRMKKGTLCKLSTDRLRFGKCATLEWLMGPPQFIF